MQERIDQFKKHVTEASASPDFIHHSWFITWHLEIVEAIANELLQHYPEADKDMVEVMVWLHDYGKILDFDNQYQMTLSAGRSKLLELGFNKAFVDRAIENIETLDKKLELDISKTSIEVQIVSSADGCSHLVGPFMYMWWHENNSKPFEVLMADTKKKALKDWNYKIVLPEARKNFRARFDLIMEQSGDLPDVYIT